MAPKTEVEIERLNIHKGQMLTVWLHGNSKSFQVELRVKKDGAPEVYLDSKLVKSFDDWTPENDG